MDFIPVEILGLHVDADHDATLVILGERGDVDRVVPIAIGPAEASAIAVGLARHPMPRPMTHDLLIDVAGALGGELVALHITELRSGTFYADLVLERAGDRIAVSSRPSDGLALAVRNAMPILMNAALLDEAGVRVLRVDDSGYDDEQIEQIVSEFREALESSDPAELAREIGELGDEDGDDDGEDGADER